MEIEPLPGRGERLPETRAGHLRDAHPETGTHRPARHLPEDPAERENRLQDIERQMADAGGEQPEYTADYCRAALASLREAIATVENDPRIMEYLTQQKDAEFFAEVARSLPGKVLQQDRKTVNWPATLAKLRTEQNGAHQACYRLNGRLIYAPHAANFLQKAESGDWQRSAQRLFEDLSPVQQEHARKYHRYVRAITVWESRLRAAQAAERSGEG